MTTLPLVTTLLHFLGVWCFATPSLPLSLSFPSPLCCALPCSADEDEEEHEAEEQNEELQDQERE